MYYYLLYFGVSKNKFSPNDFELLLNQSQLKNDNLNITGKLLHCEDTFIQLLEGDKETVESIYNSIAKDSRLVAIKIIASGDIGERYYADWNMAYANITLEEINQLEQCTHPNVAAYIKSSSAMKLLKLLAKV